MPVATDGHFLRSIAGWSEVATTRMERAMPSSPKSLRTKSRTSRPRSPTRAMTLMSAFTFLAIMPIRVLLPTPEPAKIPIRWPLPMVSSPSMAFTPNSIRSVMAGRERGLMYLPSTQWEVPASKAGPPSMGWPSALMMRPLRNGPIGRVSCFPVLRTKLPAEIPLMSE